ncbi:cupin domain-containing protein [Teredinibacter sp. KSP-S5-2]|uniref:cupin domain-containing protein n=1 Tax=Teredinibacter sp. KSP-S5-2 TaxID=3034506 RepID=UPI002934EEA4|nr:cupin domain-containing protein [Teredinibacter sp. KSP-S5-2]WNO07928.1 cupin domain-containing protein [Teredinibacter sp. KSP-S5-2]
MKEYSVEKYIVTHQEIEKFEGLHKTHFLNTNAQRLNKSLGDLTGLSHIGFHLIEVQPGRETTEFHVHYHEEECVYILQGTAEALIGDEKHQVSAGDFIGYRAGGLAHSLKNTGSEVLKCIVVGQRSEHDVADYPKLGKRIYRHRDLPWNLVDLDDIKTPTAGKKI